MGNGIIAGCVVAAVLAIVVFGYLIAWHGQHPVARKGASLMVACVLSLVGLLVARVYTILALEHVHSVPFEDAVVDNAIIWAIPVFLWVVAVRCVIFGLRKGNLN